MGNYITRSPKETYDLAFQLGATLSPGDVLAFRGGMGAGKTAFTHGLAAGLSLDDHVSSPTFALINEYQGGEKKLCHMDMYRVQGLEGAISTGFFDYLDGEWILAVEWSENIAAALPENAITVEILIVDELTRQITIKGGRL